ncbi:MAG: hypothetical protein ACREYE_20145 [Gammaproteobacteria bacterium]
MNKSTALGISRSGGARNPHVFQYTPVARLILETRPCGACALFRSRRNAPALRRNATYRRSRRFFTSSQGLAWLTGRSGHRHPQAREAEDKFQNQRPQGRTGQTSHRPTRGYRVRSCLLHQFPALHSSSLPG